MANEIKIMSFAAVPPVPQVKAPEVKIGPAAAEPPAPQLQFEKKGTGGKKVGRPALKKGEASSAPFMMLLRPDERSNLDHALAIFQDRMSSDPRIQEFLVTHFDATRGDPTSLAAAARVAATKNQMVKLALRLFAEQYLDFDITAPAPKSEPAADDLPPA